MRQITLAGNTAVLDLNKFFYPLHVLQQASTRFEKIAKVSVQEEGGRAIVSLEPKEKGSVEETALEFCNFALALKRELGEHA